MTKPELGNEINPGGGVRHGRQGGDGMRSPSAFLSSLTGLGNLMGLATHR